MQVNILYRPSQSIAQCQLEANESLMADSGAMMGMSTNVQMTTQSGGAMSGLKRMFSGESFFRNTFTSHGGRGEVLLTTPLCGDMVLLDVGQRQWIVQNSAYVGSTMGVDVQTHTTGKGFFSGAGLFALASQGQGNMIIGAFGAIEPLTVDGSTVIDTGHLVAWESTLHYDLVKATDSGWIASWLSGEGMVCHFQGQGQVYVQTRNNQEYGRAIGRQLPATDD